MRYQVSILLLLFQYSNIQSQGVCGPCEVNQKCNDRTKQCESCSDCFYYYEDELEKIKYDVLSNFNEILQKYGDIYGQLETLIKKLKNTKEKAIESNLTLQRDKNNLQEKLKSANSTKIQVHNNINNIKKEIKELLKKKLENIDQIINEAEDLLKKKPEINFNIDGLPERLRTLYVKLTELNLGEEASTDILSKISSSDFDLNSLENLANNFEVYIGECNFEKDIKALFIAITQLIPKDLTEIITKLEGYNDDIEKLVNDTEEMLDLEKELTDTLEKMNAIINTFNRILKIFQDFQIKLQNEFKRQEQEKRKIKQKYEDKLNELEDLLKELRELSKINWKLPKSFEHLSTLDSNLENINKQIQNSTCD